MMDNPVTEMLHNGICSPSDSPCSSPVILLTKNDLTGRMHTQVEPARYTGCTPRRWATEDSFLYPAGALRDDSSAFVIAMKYPDYLSTVHSWGLAWRATLTEIHILCFDSLSKLATTYQRFTWDFYTAPTRADSTTWRQSRIGRQQIEFVGHLMTSSGKKSLAGNVEKIATCEPTKDKLEPQHFLGLVNFYRDYIPNMATIVEPL